MALRLTGLMYIAMVLAGYSVEIIAQIFRFVPTERNAIVLEASVSWNYTTVLNIVFLAISAVVVIRFFKTGGRQMLDMMKAPTDSHEHHSHPMS